MKYENKAFVLGLCPNGLGVIRSLGRHRIPLVGLDYQYPMPGFFSRYASSTQCPHPFHSPDQLCAFLMNRIARGDAKGILFPTSDEFVLFVSRYRDTLSKRFLFALPDEDVLESLLNKRWQYGKAQETSTPYPRTYYPTSMENVEKIKDEIEYPVIIKPCYTHLWKEKAFGTKGFLVQDARALIEKIGHVFSTEVDVVIQSVIPGDVTDFYEVCSYLNFFHEPLCIFIKRKIRQYPHDMGLGSLMESVWDEKLAGIALNLFKGIHYRGIGEIEFKKDPRDSAYKMIEINARITLQNSLADYCGINLPLIQYADLLGESLHAPARYREHARWIWAEIDYERFRELRARKEISTVGWLKSALTSDAHAVFGWDDMGPSLAFFKGFLKRRINRERCFSE